MVVGTLPISSRENAPRYPADRRPGRYSRKRVVRSGTDRLCCTVRKSYRFKLIGEQHAAVFLYNLVDDEHDQLAQCRRRRGRDTTTVLDSCRLKYRRRAGPSVKRRGSTERKHVRLRVVFCEWWGSWRLGSLEGLGLYVDTLRHAVVHCLNISRDREEGDGMRKAMRRRRESRAMVMTLAFFVAQPMKTGRRRYSVCRPSVVIKSNSESLAGILESDNLE